MNRIELPTDPSISAPNSPTLSEYSLQRSTAFPRIRTGATPAAPYATFAPVHYESGYAYPLLVWLHGARGNERQLRQVMPLVSMRNYVAIAPRGPSADRKCRGRFGWPQTTDHIEEAESRILDCVAAAEKRFHVHPHRVFLIGCGSGGTMALRVAWRHPERFAAAATFGGPLPTDHCPLGRVNQIRHIPCLLSTCRQSRAYPEDRVCRDLRLLHTAGCTVALRQYPCGDELTTQMLADLDRWLMEIVCG